MTFASNCEIYGQGEDAEYLYKVVSGTVRTSKVLADGRRQIGSFYLPGDIFGLEVGDDHALLSRGDHRFEGAGLSTKRADRIGEL